MDTSQNSISISQFLTEFDLEISEYQRPYVWSGQQIINLYNDLIEFSSNQRDLPDYYLGNIILVKSDKSDKFDKYKIIDGQQRIISLLIIAKLLNKNFLINNLGITSQITKDNIKKNAGYLKKLISDQIIINWERLNITYIIAKNDDQAFKFYTTLSTSGKRLAGIDIIKPFHLQAISKEYQEEKAIQLEKFQFDENKLENIIKILLRARYWKGIDFKDFPRNHVDEDWKIELENEFVRNTKNQTVDNKYLFGIQCNDSIQIILPSYKTDQPLSKGINSINYILYFAELWDKIIKRINDLKLDKINKIRYLSGTEFNDEYFQAALLTFVSKFGEATLYEDGFSEQVKLLFKVCFYTRLSKPVSKDTIYNFENENRLINRILIAYTIEEIKEYCISFYNPQIIEKFNRFVNEESKNPTTIQRFAKQLDVNCDNLINPFFN